MSKTLQQENDEYYSVLINYTKNDYDKMNEINILKIFFDACLNNWLDIVKYIYNLNRIDIYYNNFYIFKRICEKGYLELARWIYELNPLKVSITDIDYIFLHCCYSGNIELISWFYNKNCEWLLRNIECGCNLFNNMMGMKLYEVARWIYNQFRLDKISEELNLNMINYDDMFLELVKNNNIDMVVWFLELNKIHPQKINYYAFEECCINGNMEMARLIYEKSPIDTQINKNMDKPFRIACENGWLDFAKWIYYVLSAENMNKKIDIKVCNHYAFRKALKNKNMHVVKWLETLEPTYKTSRIRTISN